MLHKIEGKKIHKFKGYEMIYYPEHPNSWKTGMVFFHRIVAENKIKRLLKANEIVHHIDGNKSNNDSGNLEVCVAGQDHCNNHKILFEIQCGQCGNKFMPQKSKQKYCSAECGNIRSRRADRPTAAELSKIVWSMPSVQVALKYGVSGRAIKKWCDAYGIDKPPRGYWAKFKSSRPDQ